MSRQRPLSPHLQIYKPQLTSLLSILHRATGVALSIGSVILVSWVVALSLGETAYSSYSMIINSWFGKLVLFGFTFGLFYHLSNGIRHLFWDAGYGYDLKVAYTSGSLVIISSLTLTIVTWFIVLFV
ncbi:succinate dehydrogenase, cytochrome b556 subunit [Alphaproteobacteria bacterium]|nr:succinate dehydrogenase, cytochrome b556 subunit [Alphaproteobacteria bacterium]MDB2387681.1 succinate dehydrogenase, cytochrome b556 subunit [Alphaproteobacteria bacterium]